MGQRHQVYAVITNDKKTQVVGIHHQWLYGQTALRMLGNVMAYQKNADYSSFTKATYQAQSALGALYSVDAEQGYFHGTHVLKDGETVDPCRGDNNDGITIIDFRGETPRYCFMEIGGGAGGGGANAKLFQPMTAEQYVRLYYHDGCYAYKNATPAQIAEIEKDIADLIARLAPYAVLTTDEVQGVFPMLKPRGKRVIKLESVG